MSISSKELSTKLRDFNKKSERLDAIDLGLARNKLVEELREKGVTAPTKLVDAALPKPEARQAPEEKKFFPEVTPWEDPVDGIALLRETKEWLEKYTDLPEESLYAASLWAMTTWYVASLDFACILAILSATKQSGKTTLMSCLKHLCHRPITTSGMGLTPSVTFRLNEKYHPTFLIDEAEKLSGKEGNKEIIGLLNDGHLKGKVVIRNEMIKDQQVPTGFDSFGFRAVAAIGTLWDTLMDRSIVINMRRKTVEKARFRIRTIEREGQVFARKIKRFTTDNTKAFEEQWEKDDSPAPEWLSNRLCDNWSPLFTVATVIGEEAIDIALKSAGSLMGASRSEDLGEKLIHDIRRIFKQEGNLEAIKSGKLAEKLNELEGSPWGDFRGGKGISKHKVASMAKPFHTKSPRQDRDSAGERIRGYWLEDFRDTFERYPEPPSESAQPSESGGSEDTQALATAQSLDDLSHLSHLYQSEPGIKGGLPLSSPESKKPEINEGYPSLHDKHMAQLKRGKGWH